jgi:hypothetical protein
MNAQEPTTLPGTADPSALRYTPTNTERTRFSVWLDTPGSPAIGTAQYAAGEWTAHPLGNESPATEHLPTLDLAGHALAERVPAGAVYYRQGWVTADRITRPATRRHFGLPILTAALMNNAETLFISDADDLVLSEDDTVTPAPRSGQPAVVDHGTVYWLSRNDNHPDPMSQRCDECGAEPGTDCLPFCTALPSAQDRSTLAQAPVKVDGGVDWAVASPVEWDALDEETAARAEMAWEMLLTPPADGSERPLLPGAVRIGDAEARVWAPGEVGSNHSPRHVLEVYGVNVSIERTEDGTTLVLIDAEGADTKMHVEIAGHAVSD